MRLLLAAILAATLALAAPAGAPRLVLDAEITWSARWEHFGGFSGLSVREDGAEFLAITDRGSWVTGSFERRDGTLMAARIVKRGHLHAIDNARLKDGDVDAEGLAVDGDGRAFVSFENFHRIRSYDWIKGPASAVPDHPDFSRLQQNSGLETLALDAEGTLYAIPERSGAWKRPFPVYRLRNGSWDKELRLRRDGTFLVADADFGPDGRLYLLERDFKWLGGFATRIRRFTLGPDGFEDEETLLETRFGELDNMEGISVWRDARGDIRVTLLSDDNFFPLQRTMFAEYRLGGG